MGEAPLPGPIQAQEKVKAYRRIEELIPSQWSEGTVLANGIRQHYYRTGGDKPALVLLHGFLEGALSWLRTARVLEQDYDVIMVDARGHGLSDRIGSAGFSQELLTEDAAGFLRALQVGSARVLGFSQGAGTGIHLAAAYPDQVRLLIAEGWSEATNTDLSQSEGYRAWLNAYLSWLESLKTQTHEERMVSGLTQLPPGSAVPPEDEYVPSIENAARLDLELVRLGVTMWSGLPERVRQMVQALHQITCPALIMKSSFAPTRDAKAIREEASDRPNIRVVRFENTGHLIHQEQFGPFIGLVQQFFREHE